MSDRKISFSQSFRAAVGGIIHRTNSGSPSASSRSNLDHNEDVISSPSAIFSSSNPPISSSPFELKSTLSPSKRQSRDDQSIISPIQGRLSLEQQAIAEHPASEQISYATSSEKPRGERPNVARIFKIGQKDESVGGNNSAGGDERSGSSRSMSISLSSSHEQKSSSAGAVSSPAHSGGRERESWENMDVRNSGQPLQHQQSDPIGPSRVSSSTPYPTRYSASSTETAIPIPSPSSANPILDEYKRAAENIGRLAPYNRETTMKRELAKYKMGYERMVESNKNLEIRLLELSTENDNLRIYAKQLEDIIHQLDPASIVLGNAEDNFNTLTAVPDRNSGSSLSARPIPRLTSPPIPDTFVAAPTPTNAQTVTKISLTPVTSSISSTGTTTTLSLANSEQLSFADSGRFLQRQFLGNDESPFLPSSSHTEDQRRTSLSVAGIVPELQSRHIHSHHGSSSGSYHSNPPVISKEICRHFLRGKCRYKQHCKFSHELERCPYCNEELPVGKVAASAHLYRCWKAVNSQIPVSANAVTAEAPLSISVHVADQSAESNSP